MPILVHVADKKNERRIRDAGIAPGKLRPVVYFMPVVESHFVSHQWVRELKRKGIKNFIGVYFRLGSDERVWSGNYREEHVERPLGEAIAELRALDEPLGYELFIARKIQPSELHRIRDISPKTGWRYYPGAHGTKPCGCPACLEPGEFKSSPIRQRWKDEEEYRLPPLHVAKQRFLDARTPEELDLALDDFALFKRWKVDPSFLSKALDPGDDDLAERLAGVLGSFRHANATKMLLRLCGHGCEDVRETAAESLCKVHGHQARQFLQHQAEDPTIAFVLSESGF